MNPQISGNLARIKHVKGAVAIIGEKVGDIDQRRDRPQANGAQPILKPFRRRAVFNTPDKAAGKNLTAIGGCIFVNRHGDRAGELPFDMGRFDRLHRAKPARRKIKGNTAYAQGIGAVGGDRDFDHRVDLGGVIDRKPVDKAFTYLARGQLDDAVVFFAQLHFAFGTHHAIAFDATDFADADGAINAGHVNAGLGDHNGDPFAGIGRATDDLGLAFIGVHLANPKSVCIGVRFGLDDLADGKIGQPACGVRHALYLKAEVGQRLGDFVNRGRGV